MCLILMQLYKLPNYFCYLPFWDCNAKKAVKCMIALNKNRACENVIQKCARPMSLICKEHTMAVHVMTRQFT